MIITNIIKAPVEKQFNIKINDIKQSFFIILATSSGELAKIWLADGSIIQSRDKLFKPMKKIFNLPIKYLILT